MEFIFKRNMKVMLSKVKDLDMIEGKVPYCLSWKEEPRWHFFKLSQVTDTHHHHHLYDFFNVSSF